MTVHHYFLQFTKDYLTK